MARKASPGSVANEFVRLILTEVGLKAGGLSKADWQRTLDAFGNKCAYTGAADKPLVQEHAVPLNRTHGGLHVYGNVVPATQEANSQKAGKRYDDFLRSKASKLTSLSQQSPAQREEAITKIDGFMAAARRENPSAMQPVVQPELLAYYEQKYRQVTALCAATSDETDALLKRLGAAPEPAEQDGTTDEDEQTYASAEAFEHDEPGTADLPEAYALLFEQYENLKIGAFARAVFKQLFADGRIAPLLKQLQDTDYSRLQLGLYYPALVRNRNATNSGKYYAPSYRTTNGHEYYLCNDWYRSRRGTFEDWLTDTVFGQTPTT